MSRKNTVKKENIILDKDEAQVKIVAKNINRSYHVKRKGNNKAEEFIALKDFNLEIHAGEFLTIVGPSGCGKSTFLDILAGLGRADSGEIYMDGKVIKGPALDRGIVMQGYALFPWRTVRQNIEYGLEIKKIPKKERREISQKFIELVGLKGFEDRYSYELSGGMRQRVAIARALAYDPEVLLMDEPFAAVDAQTRETLQDELLRIWEKTNKTIVFITHSIEEAVFLGDRIAVMSANPGRIKEIVEVNLPRPRKLGDIRTTTNFNWISHKIWELLHENEEKKTVKKVITDKSVAEEISPSANL
ncbi:ABC transporter ATP-binding protein [Clostridium sp. DJ247]|uniref:ABC transporter ATP-binding protein n=1 Tax=Clostridium sp. DJ247 TaxID=2726188 RepID=UPI001626FBE7|nr:ABC transporter ATP-binding protein [Clostridium sp. DJ247]MBC2580708.1 ABC transporter ATP-binding protein [Clostridium sp. DJ247]